jgi:small-conductance mechanosensitive channel
MRSEFAEPGVSSFVLTSARLTVSFVVLGAMAVVLRLALTRLGGTRSRLAGKQAYWTFGGLVGAVLLLLLLLPVADAALSSAAAVVGRLIPAIGSGWPRVMLTGIYHLLIATGVVVALIQAVGGGFRLAVARLEAAQRRAEAAPGGASHWQTHLLLALAELNRIARVAVLALLVLAYLIAAFRLFPATRSAVDVLAAFLLPPARGVGLAILEYLPNAGYVVVIVGLGGLGLRLMRYVFQGLSSGRLVLPGFDAEWAKPTYKLCRILLLLFLLMVAYPFLPGASSQFFQGFSVFAGALFTLGATTAISNVVAGVVLTYTRAFRVGDVVRIGETQGVVLEKTLLVTRLRTLRNEEVTLPNGSVLSAAILNFSRPASSEGLVLTVSAGIGYDVEWRTVHRLMLEAARRTERVLAEPAPGVWQTALGDYAVSYELRAWTDDARRMGETHSKLRSNVLDAFHQAGVEIMTPGILAHRDASRPAIPVEQGAELSPAHGIRIAVERAPDPERE